VATIRDEAVGRHARARDNVTGGIELDEFTAISLADATWVQTDTTVRQWKEHCAKLGVAPLPVLPELLKSYVLALARKGRRYATIQTRLGCLGTWCRIHDQVLQRKHLTNILRGIAKAQPKVDQAEPLMLDQLLDILDHMDQARPADIRDSAALAVPWAGALRGAEACALDYQRAGPEHDDANAGWIEIVEKGALIVLTRSKNSPIEPVSITIPKTWAQQALDWLARWAAHADLQPGSPVFRPLTRGRRVLPDRLRPPAITEIVRRRMTQHFLRKGLDAGAAHVAALDYSAHSLRAGFLSSAANSGVEDWKLRDRGRHATPEVAASYVRLHADWTTSYGIAL
jgi:site-specific recombinase XerC